MLLLRHAVVKVPEDCECHNVDFVVEGIAEETNMRGGVVMGILLTMIRVVVLHRSVLGRRILERLGRIVVVDYRCFITWWHGIYYYVYICLGACL